MKRSIRQDQYASVIGAINARLPPEQRLDANETAILTRQLVDIDARAFDQLYPELKGTRLFPVKSDINPGARTYLYEVRDYAGQAKRVTNWATDFPGVDVQSGEVEARLESYGDSYAYTLQDARASLMAGRSIEDSRALAAREVLARKLDVLIATGDSDVGITGALNNASVPTFSPVTGVWSNAGTDGAEIAQDLMAMLGDIRVDSRGSESADAILLPPSLEEIAQRKLIPNTDVTAMDFFKKNRPGITVDTWERLETAGAGGVPRVMAYTRREEKVCSLVPVEFETFAPQQEGLAWKVLCHLRAGGVIFRYPGSARYMDGCA
jgi:hypothetical protein